MIGKTLAHYEITSLLGKGGMGEVYQAKDLKLGRDVAIKVLPDEFAKDADRVARFQREAKLLASLNHPNIASIYGLEESGKTNFLVLELVEGETLADRIKAGPIPVGESLKLALQIAEALEAAHEKGVIHRDLKPANIKVTPDGKVKVLDFGLAKAFGGEQAEMVLSNSPTLSAAATQQGVILGTAAYMSPEQAKGKAVDKRSDIWAFGAVLFEILTGKPAFPGEEVSEILASVIKSDTNLDLLPPNIHPRVREALARCLQKDLRKRYYAIADVRFEIEQVLADPGGLFVQEIPGTEPRPKIRAILPWIAATVAITALAAGAVAWFLKPAPPAEPKRVVRFEYELPGDQQFGDLTERAFAISPDGSQFVYKTSKGLYLRSINDLNARPISGTGENPQKPFFSPDGQWIGYVSGVDGELKKISINGGGPVSLTKIDFTGFLDWRADHTIMYASRLDGKIMRISETGGNPQLFAKGERASAAAPQILPDGKSVVYTEWNNEQDYKIVAQSLESGKRKELVIGDTAQYLPTGHLVYAADNRLFAVPFDPVKLELTGDSIPIVEGVLRAGGAPQYAVSDSGALIYMTGGSASNKRTIVWVDRQGKEEPLGAEPGDYRSLRISPDGTQVALAISTGRSQDIYIWDIIRQNMRKLTFDEADDCFPLWTPDGQRIFFTSNRKGNSGIYWKAADGTGEDELLGSVSDQILVPASWSADKKTLALGMAKFTSTLSDIGTLSLEGDKTAKPLLQTEHWESAPNISPNGKWMAYIVNEPGRDPFSQYEIYVCPFPNVKGGKWKVSTNGGYSPRWAQEGRELFYSTDDALMVVAVESEPTFKYGTPKVLLERALATTFSLGLTGSAWDISRDGKRFLMSKELAAPNEESAEKSPRKIIIVLNWLEELKQRAQAGK